MKPRLFVFGDSFVEWMKPKYHWTSYLSEHYEVFKYGIKGADNHTILFQLGNLPEYREGDRIIILFTEPGRIPRRYFGNRKNEHKILDEHNFNCTCKSCLEQFEDKEFVTKLHLLKYYESDRWASGERNIEVKFLKNLLGWIKHYNPVCITWSGQFHTVTSDFVTLIKVSSNYEEGLGELKDFHPGPLGCYDLYKRLYLLLNLKDKLAEFKDDNFDYKNKIL